MKIIPEKLPNFLFEIAELAQENGQNIYLVGGAVRDLLLGQQLIDYDLLCNLNAIKLVSFLEKKKYASIKSLHGLFGTAKIQLLNSEKIQIDLATARAETYDYPGALPRANFPVLIEEDLKRRDFTINAIALKINANHELQFIDPFDGRGDLRRKIIQVLHSKSYYEDPTRIIRAARFAKRFNCQISASDLAQIKEAFQNPELIGLSERLRGIRIGVELRRLLELPDWLGAAALFSEIDGWKLCRPNLKMNFQKPKINLISWETRLLWLLWSNQEKLSKICQELGFNAKSQKQIIFLQSLLGSAEPEISLKLFRKIAELESEYKNLLFALSGQWQDLFEKMQSSLPETKPQELLEKGLRGQEINEALERIFLENFSKQF